MVRTRKIAMAKRETAEKRSVTLTKRRQGLFSKAAAICWICNAQVAILVTSICSKEKVYSFGNPSVDSVFDRFLNNSSSAPAEDDDDTARSARSLWKDRKALENELGVLLQNKKGNSVSEGELLAGFDEFEKSNSIEDLQAVKDSLQTLLIKARSKLNSSNPSTSALAIDNIKPISDDLWALDGLGHCGDSPPSSLDDVTSSYSNSGTSFAYISCNNNVSETGSNGFDGVPSFVAEPNSSSNSNTDSDFPSGNADADYLWSLISVPSDFSNISSDAFPMANSAADDNYGTPWTTPYELASGSGTTRFEDAEFSDFGAVNHYEVWDENCNAKQDFSVSDYGFMDLVGEYGNCMIDHQGLPLLMAEANPFEDLIGY